MDAYRRVEKDMRSGCATQQFSLVFTLVLSMLTPLSASAANTPYRAELELSGLNQIGVYSTSSKTFDAIPAVKVSGKIANLGRIDARFNLRRNKTWTSTVEKRGAKYLDPVEPVLLRGKVAVGGGTVRKGRRVYKTAASIIKNELRITIPGRATGSRRSRQRIYTVRVLLNGSIRVSARVSSIPAHAFYRGACGSAVGSVSVAQAVGHTESEDNDHTVLPIPFDEAPVGGANSDQATATKVITISTDADPEWYAKYGDSSNAVIASIINTAEAIYDAQLGIRFRLVKQHVYTGNSPYTMTDANALLRAFTGNPDNKDNLGDGGSDFHEKVDIKHLFTGKNLDGSVIGIAYIGTVCAAPALTFGITQSYVEAANAGIFAHELGHNFGGFHDVSDRGGLMYPSISVPSATRFSSASLDEISDHLGRYNRCISVEEMTPRQAPRVEPTATPQPPVVTPPPAPARISLRRTPVGSRRERLYRVSGRVISDAGRPLGAVKLRLVVQGKSVAQVVSDDRGQYNVLVKFSIPRGRQVYTYVETVDGMVYSRFMWIGATRG
jgi:hypothetical protein